MTTDNLGNTLSHHRVNVEWLLHHERLTVFLSRIVLVAVCRLFTCFQGIEVISNLEVTIFYTKQFSKLRTIKGRDPRYVSHLTVLHPASSSPASVGRRRNTSVLTNACKVAFLRLFTFFHFIPVHASTENSTTAVLERQVLNHILGERELFSNAFEVRAHFLLLPLGETRVCENLTTAFTGSINQPLTYISSGATRSDLHVIPEPVQTLFLVRCAVRHI
ncbi:hypothetical protein JG005_00001 [Pseudomonas phage JG005]